MIWTEIGSDSIHVVNVIASQESMKLTQTKIARLQQHTKTMADMNLSTRCLRAPMVSTILQHSSRTVFGRNCLAICCLSDQADTIHDSQSSRCCQVNEFCQGCLGCAVLQHSTTLLHAVEEMYQQFYNSPAVIKIEAYDAQDGM